MSHGALFLSVSVKKESQKLGCISCHTAPHFFGTLSKSCNLAMLQFPYLKKVTNSSLGIVRVKWRSTWKWTLSTATQSLFPYFLLSFRLISELFQERGRVLFIIIYFHYYHYITMNTLLLFQIIMANIYGACTFVGHHSKCFIGMN